MDTETKLPSKTIAEAAIEILDERGEFAALPFLLAHTDDNQEPADWLGQGRLTLQDGSTVEHADIGYYEFRWRGPDGNECKKLKASAMRAQGRPEVPVGPRVFLDWPTIVDVQERIDEIVEHRAGIEPDESRLSFPEMCKAAPSLYWAILRANAEASFPGPVYKHLDPSVVAIAEYALDQLPTEEMERLKDAYVAACNSG